MKRLALLVIAAAFLGTANAHGQTTPTTPITSGSPFAYTIQYDLAEKQFDALAGYRLGSVKNLFGKSWLNASVYSLGGTGVAANGTAGLAGGGSLVFTGPISSGIVWQAGPAFLTGAGQKPHGAIFFGIAGSLGN